MKKNRTFLGGVLAICLSGLVAACGSGSGDAKVVAAVMEDCMMEVGNRKLCECSLGKIKDNLSKSEYAEWVRFEGAVREAGSQKAAREMLGVSVQEFNALNERFTSVGMQAGMQCMMAGM